jgi:hypothetical protein
LLLITEDAAIACAHATGRVRGTPSQDLVRVSGRRVLVEPDPAGWQVAGCSNTNPVIGIKPCTLTLAVADGYSSLVRVGGRRVCLEAVTGLTDGTPPGAVKYGVTGDAVKTTGQNLVRELP